VTTFADLRRQMDEAKQKAEAAWAGWLVDWQGERPNRESRET